MGGHRLVSLREPLCTLGVYGGLAEEAVDFGLSDPEMVLLGLYGATFQTHWETVWKRPKMT